MEELQLRSSSSHAQLHLSHEPSYEQIIDSVRTSPNPKIKVAITDIDGVLRGKYIHKDKFFSILRGGFGFCNVVFGWDIQDASYDNSSYTGWDTGFPDAVAKVDLTTMRKVPWDNDVLFFLGDFDNDICPRTLLRRVKHEAESLGFGATFGQEFEWFNFRETSESLNDKGFQNPEPITRGMFGYSVLRIAHNREFFNELYDLLNKFRVPIEGLHTETGPGVLEAAILFDDVLESADRAVLFKTSVKEIGLRHGIMPTFMAKIREDLPGCSGHLHQSLWRNGKNTFFDEERPHGMSEIMESYMAGILHCLPEILPMFAPTINSYKRLVEGAWAPTTLTWGIDNRTVCLRALPLSEKSTRLELRVVGSDANPYLAHAASLAAGLYGVKNKLKLNTPQASGNGYRTPGAVKLPTSLRDATLAMKNSELARELFGEKFVEHFTESRDWECRAYDRAVTDWEFKRYCESI